ncbi:MAG: ABC transporter ATP-binding protein [Clostridium sp.]|uniref:ABC transporter ATP-binding protein n=1 Tax=Clostridium TaxID=1485 RepID=UPI0021535FA3|nr:ABC transporter ATP-binding protein [Clostridium sp. LY3-2]MCR6516030.1 ABC transporter ATP-binding protein [Clostridium sp. LY3-2]
MKVLEVNNLKKRIGSREIIKDLNFSIEEGEIFGFLGPNGAGKTTTIRMLVGLMLPTYGEIKICGINLVKDKEIALRDVGAIVENPELYSYLTGRQNLMQIARIRRVSKEEIEELIKTVGLQNRIDDKVKKYSLGMKQRLGLAAALIGRPKLLILDEPTNGLDPSGIIDFRNIVKTASRKYNMSVLISSHILSEIQQLCDRVAFINEGVIQSVEDMNIAIHNIEKESLSLVVSSDIKEALLALQKVPFVASAKEKNGVINIIIEWDMTPELIENLVKYGVKIEEIRKNRDGLERRYMELVKGGVK